MGPKAPLIIKDHFTSIECANVFLRDVGGGRRLGQGWIEVALGIQVKGDLFYNFRPQAIPSIDLTGKVE